MVIRIVQQARDLVLGCKVEASAPHFLPFLSRSTLALRKDDTILQLLLSTTMTFGN